MTNTPTVDSRWQRRDGTIDTVTRLSVIHDRPNVHYTSTRPEGGWGVGVSRTDVFVAARTLLDTHA
ncbi:hypothetical protein AB0B63_07330 [Micromonospora sp. NPDC049081]|uniref:hypothetical protein n=1 Tax=Micromonospora sp. NPDC049081 TaxID=3155150 RepID=UPI00340247E1